ncbi:MAG: IS21 family transposase [Planctomycetes bacterium]|nr:IS21 family transposase [Planctomycetota bacterium]
MLSDDEVREAWRLLDGGLPLVHVARRLGRSEGALRRYLDPRRLPSQVRKERTHRTRQDPFEEEWPELAAMLKDAPGLEAKTLFWYLCEKQPGKWQEGQLRTLQRRIRDWRALHGPDKEVFFQQVHHPGRAGQSDFTRMKTLGITIGGEPFEHMLYHFMLPYSNWEHVGIAFSETFAALSQGVQDALWKLGGVPKQHRTDNLSAATHDLKKEKGRAFNRSYQRLMDHYETEPTTNTPGRGHENGDVEKSHDLFKRELNQRLLLRGSRDFATRAKYEAFLRMVEGKRNALRSERFAEDRAALKALPRRRIEDYEEREAKVRGSSTIYVLQNAYSVPSRLIGHTVKVRVYAEHLEVRYGQKVAIHLERLHGTKRARINYRHLIGWLIRKPGAFADYHYREELYPQPVFRRAYDALVERIPGGATLEYLRILKLAAETMECEVAAALGLFLDEGELPTSEAVKAIVDPRPETRPEVHVDEPDPSAYDALLELEAA